jgi:hypothetical protein
VVAPRHSPSAVRGAQAVRGRTMPGNRQAPSQVYPAANFGEFPRDSAWRTHRAA